MKAEDRRGTTATIKDESRKREWIDILGTDTIPIKSPIPTWASLPDRDDALIYELDLTTLTSEQRGRLVNHIARKFDFSPEEVENRLADEGVPILADDVVVTGYDVGLFL